MHIASKYGDLAFVELFIQERIRSAERRQQVDVDVACIATGWTPLHYAAFYRHANICRYLIHSGAVPHLLETKPPRGGAGRTPLEVVQSLLKDSQVPAAHKAELKEVEGELVGAIKEYDTKRRNDVKSKAGGGAEKVKENKDQKTSKVNATSLSNDSSISTEAQSSDNVSMLSVVLMARNR